MPPPYIRKLYFRRKKEIGESDLKKKNYTWNSEAVIRMFPIDLKEYPFVYKPRISEKFIAISRCGPILSAADQPRPYLHLNVLG